jgi:hypothetical protein
MKRRFFPAVAATLFPSVLFAAPIAGESLTFDGLQVGEQVLTYYDGGFGSLGSGPGPLDGVSFTTGLAVESTAIAFGPSAQVTAASVTMDLDSPWSGFFSFYFAGNGVVSLYSGRDATGTLLGSFTTPRQTGVNGVFDAFGTFQSAVFAPTPGSAFLVDSITFGGVVVPEPAGATLFAAGVISILVLRRKGSKTRAVSSAAAGPDRVSPT